MPLISGGSQPSGKNSNKPRFTTPRGSVIEICPWCQGRTGHGASTALKRRTGRLRTVPRQGVSPAESERKSWELSSSLHRHLKLLNMQN